MSSRVKIIIAVLIIAILLGIGYLIFFNSNSDTSAVSSDGNGAPASAAEATFLNLASQIDPISFDTTVLADPRFTSLVDIHTAIVPEPEGRSDPFAP